MAMPINLRSKNANRDSAFLESPENSNEISPQGGSFSKHRDGGPFSRTESDMSGHSPIQNENIFRNNLINDYLYHFNIDTTLDLQEKFGNVNVVITAGDSGRIDMLAETLRQEYSVQEPLVNLTDGQGRFVLYCVEHVLLFNHGMGSGSASIAFHEIFKLLHYAKVDRSSVKFIRIGTCGGVDVEPGTVCFTDNALTETLDTMFPFVECGKVYPVPMILSKPLTAELIECTQEINVPYVSGNTLGTNDFYLGQGRLDGAFCNYTEQDKREFLEKLVAKGVKNIEMESHTFGAFCTRAKIDGAVMCVALLNRIIDDTIRSTKEQRSEWISRASRILIKFCHRYRLSKQSNKICLGSFHRSFHINDVVKE